LQDTYKSETTSAYETLKSDYNTATATCNDLTQQLNKQQVGHRAELAALQETHAASMKEQQLEAEGLRQQLQAAQARAATAEEQLAAAKAAAKEDAATITTLRANVTGVLALPQSCWHAGSTVFALSSCAGVTCE
jgi:septal ring factor EnvC (AmiA/AmiB activator)